MLRTKCCLGGVCLWFLLTAVSVEAHFLFAWIERPAAGPPQVEVYFSESPSAGDPKFVAKIAHTQLWSQDAAGRFTEVKVSAQQDRLIAPLPTTAGRPAPAGAVVGICQYGVLTRDVAFLLRYHPKLIFGAAEQFAPEQAARWKRHESTPLEMMPQVVDGRLRLTLLWQGQPVPEATLTTVDSDLANTELKTDTQGVATWQPPAAGRYAVYARHVTPQTGTLDGKMYQEIRDFATLSFEWPLSAAAPAQPAR